jgi:DNA-binding MltR family transcriptional regulator
LTHELNVIFVKEGTARVLLLINYSVVIKELLVKFGTVPDLDVTLNVVWVLIIVVAWGYKIKRDYM